MVASLEVLSSIVPHPQSLRSIHLALARIQYLNPSLLRPLADASLLTLSLKTSDYSIFRSSLTFPHLITLSIELKSTLTPSTEGPRAVWNLPSLTNLSIRCRTVIQDTATIDFISHLLVRQLKALRMKRPRYAGINTSLRTFWSEFAQLQALATNFPTIFQNGQGQGIPIHELHRSLRRIWPGGIPLRHFIQNGTNEPEAALPSLIKFIEHCPSLETVSLSPPEGYKFWDLYKHSKAARRLEKICRSRGVRLLDAEGLDIKMIVKPK